MLTEAGCRVRQERLRDRMQRLNLDAVVLTDYPDIYYFTGVFLREKMPAFPVPACLYIPARGPSWLAADTDAGGYGLDERLTYEWNLWFTTHPDHAARLNAVVADRLKGAAAVKCIGWQAEAMPRGLANVLADVLHPDEWVAIDEDLRAMQTRKDADEIEIIRRCVQIDLAGYTAACAAIAPGVTELAVLAAGQRGAMLAAGEPVYHGGDYRSRELGGPARNRIIEMGELFIIDAQTYYGGYWSDLSRTYLVGDMPTPLQRSLFDHIAAVQRKVPALLKPGVDGRDIWRAVDRMVREHPALADSGLIHHAGHSVGLRAHELPDLNRDRGGLLEPGNIITVEPGAYLEAARYGVRIENMYLITEDGAENLSEYPVELV
jgi:Xaa-Pro dipeptidase